MTVQARRRHSSGPAFARHAISDLSTTVAWPRHGPAILLCWHGATLALVVFASVFEVAGPRPLAEGYTGRFFVYLTNWTWWLLGVRAALGALVCLKARGAAGKAGALQPQSYTLLHKAFAVLSAVLPTACVIVTLTYWAALAGQRVYLEEPITHGANAAIMVAEVALTRLPVTTTWVVFPVGYLAAYALFQIIYWAGTEQWVYPRTDFRDCDIAPGYFALPFSGVVVYALMCAPLALHHARCDTICASGRAGRGNVKR